MQGFEPVTLSWGGEDFTVQADNVLELVAHIEDALCGADQPSAVVALMRPGGPTHVRLSRAYGAALRYAKASVTDEEIYLSIQDDFASGKTDVSVKINAAIMGLLKIVSPPVAMSLVAPSAKKPRAPRKKKPKA